MTEAAEQGPGPGEYISPPMEMQSGEPLGSALIRMALEQLAILRDGFSLPSGGPELDGTVHMARKAAKRTRALLRLVRNDLGTETYRNENAVIRDQSRLLSKMRIARVLITTFEELPATARQEVPQGTIDHVRTILEDNYVVTARRLRGDVDGVAAAKVALDCVRSRIASWEPPAAYREVGIAALHPGIERSYASGRKARRTAKRDRTAHNFHDWRKQVNYLRFQMEALSGAAAPPVALLAESLHELSEILGTEHDLADLDHHVAADPGPPDRMHLATLHASIEDERRRLQRVALRASKKVYSPRPGDFISSNAKHWG